MKKFSIALCLVGLASGIVAAFAQAPDTKKEHTTMHKEHLAAHEEHDTWEAEHGRWRAEHLRALATLAISSIDRVVSFGLAIVSVQSASQVRVTKLVSDDRHGVIAIENASARLSDAWDTLENLSNADRRDVLEINSAYPNPLPSGDFLDPLLAPVSVR